ncbi:MAG: YbgF trimerization domain-containing protein, partial [bacterium]
MTHFKSYLLALIAFITPYLAIPAQAVPVEERGMPRGESTSETIQSAAPLPAVTQTPPPPVTSDSYGTLQLLQQEVMELRGLVEQLSHQVRELRERQEADYLDLDRRISATAQPQGSAQHSTPAPISPSVDAGATVPTPPATTASTAPSAAVTSPGDEVADYSAAYGLLKQGKFEESKAALRGFIERYPNGDYAANAHYWLGEIYLLDNDLNEAVS